MCFSYEISMATFLFSWSVSIYLLSKNLIKKQRQNVIFLMIFSSMQLVDAILWKNKMKKNNINYYLTSYIIPLILSAQIIYSIFFINKNVPWYILLIAFGTILGLFLSFTNRYTRPSENIFGSPLWGGKELNPVGMIIFFLIIFYGRMGFSNSDFSINLLAGIATLCITFLFSGGFGSIWCAFANIMSIVYLFRYG